MHRMSPAIPALACASLLATQWSGLHMHVDANGYSGTPQGTHVHSQGTHSHGDETHADHAADHGHSHDGDDSHDGDKDVSIIELSTGSSKLVILPVWMGVSLLIPFSPGEKLSPYSTVPRPVGRHERWRPPQRAPPRLS